jgi:hypothetical protein
MSSKEQFIDYFLTEFNIEVSTVSDTGSHFETAGTPESATAILEMFTAVLEGRKSIPRLATELNQIERSLEGVRKIEIVCRKNPESLAVSRETGKITLWRLDAKPTVSDKPHWHLRTLQQIKLIPTDPH